MKLDALVDKYLEAKKVVWSETTFRSEVSRFRTAIKFCGGGPNETYRLLKHAGYKPYTIKTTMIRLNELFLWAKKLGYISVNNYDGWLKEHSYLFKNAYKKKTLSTDFKGAKEKISTIEDNTIRETALFLLRSGIRIHELRALFRGSDGHLYVTGKGDKTRRVFAPHIPHKFCEDYELRRELKKLGLTPHDLRRLFATKLMRSGLAPQDVAAATGHSSIETLMRYLQADSEDKLETSIQGALSNE